MKKTSHFGLMAFASVWIGLLFFAETSSATLEIQKKAKAAGYAASNCMYCHNEKLPKKGAVSHNERGKWLLAEKERRKAAEVDATWLKDCPVK
ncbi:MAG TPA: hypothetical protein VID50_05470 [Candidatus Eisenbacteria bacterium]|jgi:hypothetical protein